MGEKGTITGKSFEMYFLQDEGYMVNEVSMSTNSDICLLCLEIRSKQNHSLHHL